MKRNTIAAILILTLATFAIKAMEPTVISAAGLVESTAGGFKFPDGSVQSAAAFPAASQCTAITTVPMTINVAGVYCFTGDLSTSAPTGIAINIGADNVTINMNGWTLDGLGAGTGTFTSGIFATEKKNITIRNGTISGFFEGIKIIDSPSFAGASHGHVIEDIRLAGNTTYGIYLDGDRSIIRRNQIVNTGGQTAVPESPVHGMYLASGSGNRVVNNSIAETGALDTGDSFGVFILNGAGFLVENNYIDSVFSVAGDSYGIRVHASLDVIIRGNTLSFMDTGVSFVFISTGKYMDNLTNSVTTAFVGGTAVGTNNN